VRGGEGRVAGDIRGPVFFEVRDPREQPVCGFYASAIRRLMYLLQPHVEGGTGQWRGPGPGKGLSGGVLRTSRKSKIQRENSKKRVCAGVRCTFLRPSLRRTAFAFCISNFAFCIGAAHAQSPVTPGARQLVMPFENETHEARYDWLGEGAASVLSEDLTALGA